MLVLCGVYASCMESNDARPAVSLGHSLVVIKRQNSDPHQEYSAKYIIIMYHYAFPCDVYIMASISIKGSGMKHMMISSKGL
jgi:hypothetical protein